MVGEAGEQAGRPAAELPAHRGELVQVVLPRHRQRGHLQQGGGGHLRSDAAGAELVGLELLAAIHAVRDREVEARIEQEQPRGEVSRTEVADGAPDRLGATVGDAGQRGVSAAVVAELVSEHGPQLGLVEPVQEGYAEIQPTGAGPEPEPASRVGDRSVRLGHQPDLVRAVRLREVRQLPRHRPQPGLRLLGQEYAGRHAVTRPAEDAVEHGEQHGDDQREQGGDGQPREPEPQHLDKGHDEPHGQPDREHVETHQEGDRQAGAGDVLHAVHPRVGFLRG